ncbi:hypothetical protein V8C42DRAFT_17608 [Trichoderma barbatum]
MQSNITKMQNATTYNTYTESLNTDLVRLFPSPPHSPALAPPQDQDSLLYTNRTREQYRSADMRRWMPHRSPSFCMCQKKLSPLFFSCSAMASAHYVLNVGFFSFKSGEPVFFFFFFFVVCFWATLVLLQFTSSASWRLGLRICGRAHDANGQHFAGVLMRLTRQSTVSAIAIEAQKTMLSQGHADRVTGPLVCYLCIAAPNGIVYILLLHFTAAQRTECQRYRWQ